MKRGHVYVLEEDLRDMDEYSMSMPTGPSPGRYWKRDENVFNEPPKWVVAWVVDDGRDDGTYAIHWADVTVMPPGWVTMSPEASLHVRQYPDLPQHKRFPSLNGGLNRHMTEPHDGTQLVPRWVRQLEQHLYDKHRARFLDAVETMRKAARMPDACSAAFRLDGLDGLLALVCAAETDIKETG